jgi:hypothetical protein
VAVMRNLNKFLIPTDTGEGLALGDWNLGLGDATVHFRDLKQKLIRYIGAADYVFGCVAWLTDLEILAALRGKRGVSLVIQKEDFLRPDGNSKNFRRDVYDAYTSLPTVERYQFRLGVANELSTSLDPRVQGVRVVGFPRSGDYGPRMHHKFCVFAKHNEELETWHAPHAVWTGSFNWTQSASNSLENAVYIDEPKAAKGFYLEFQQVLALSEPPDWTAAYVAPEWRIGT